MELKQNKIEVAEGVLRHFILFLDYLYLLQYIIAYKGILLSGEILPKNITISIIEY